MVLASKVPLPSRGAKVGRLQSREVATQDKQGDIGKKKGKSAAVLARSVVTWTSDGDDSFERRRKRRDRQETRDRDTPRKWKEKRF